MNIKDIRRRRWRGGEGAVVKEGEDSWIEGRTRDETALLWTCGMII
jgi:hypothetical protein